MTPSPPSRCAFCVDQVATGLEHWSWNSDAGNPQGGKWRCRAQKREAERRRLARIKADPERAASRRENYLAYGAAHRLENRVRTYRAKDSKRGVPSITFAEAEPLLKAPCHYCEGEGGGLDRLDHNLGHELANVRPCCSECNYILSDLPVQVKDLIGPALKASRKAGLLTAWKAPHLR